MLSGPNGRVQLVYISPECLLGNARFHAMMLSDLYQKRLGALVVDEAHCVKLWLVKHDICITVIVCFPCRGDDFRVLFAEIGDIRGLIPKTVKILALTATATRETLECVKSRLSLEDPVIVGLPPNRSNIKYIIKPVVSILDLCHQLTDELKMKRTNAPKTVLFCRSLSHCAIFFDYMKRLLGKDLTEPSETKPTLGVCLVDVFTSVTKSDMQEMLLKEFSKTSSVLRLLIATTAFGLGVDCPDID